MLKVNSAEACTALIFAFRCKTWIMPSHKSQSMSQTTYLYFLLILLCYSLLVAKIMSKFCSLYCRQSSSSALLADFLNMRDAFSFSFPYFLVLCYFVSILVMVMQDSVSISAYELPKIKDSSVVFSLICGQVALAVSGLVLPASDKAF